MAWRGGRTAGSGVWGPVVFRATHPAIDLLVPLAVSPGWPINPRRRTVPLPPFCAAICRPVSRLCWVKKSLFAESCSDGSFKLRVVGGLRAEFRPRALLTAGRCWQQRAQLAQPLSLGACTACCQSVPATVQTAECIRDCGLAGCPRLLSERTRTWKKKWVGQFIANSVLRLHKFSKLRKCSTATMALPALARRCVCVCARLCSFWRVMPICLRLAAAS